MKSRHLARIVAGTQEANHPAARSVPQRVLTGSAHLRTLPTMPPPPPPPPPLPEPAREGATSRPRPPGLDCRGSGQAARLAARPQGRVLRPRERRLRLLHPARPRRRAARRWCATWRAPSLARRRWSCHAGDLPRMSCRQRPGTGCRLRPRRSPLSARAGEATPEELGLTIA